MSQPILHDKNRTVVAVSGRDAQKLLSGIVTNSLPEEGAARYGALLTPQGKVMFDFLIAQADGRYLIDIDAGLADDFVKRLGLYRLRADAVIEKTGLAVLLGHAPGIISFTDPRHEELGVRTISEKVQGGEDLHPYHENRMALGVPLGGVDFVYGEAFPHEADMDLLDGIDFRKGCYVGQEVVSRVHHKSGARKRIVPVTLEEPVIAPVDVMAGDQSIGMLTSVLGHRGLALVRLDKAHKALGEGTPLRAGETTLRLEKPQWMNIPFPGEASFGPGQ